MDLIFIFGAFMTLGGSSFGYLLLDNKTLKEKIDKAILENLNLKFEIDTLNNNLFILVIAIKETREIPNSSPLNKKADEILHELKKLK